MQSLPEDTIIETLFFLDFDELRGAVLAYKDLYTLVNKPDVLERLAQKFRIKADVTTFSELITEYYIKYRSKKKYTYLNLIYYAVKNDDVEILTLNDIN